MSMNLRRARPRLALQERSVRTSHCPLILVIVFRSRIDDTNTLDRGRDPAVQECALLPIWIPRTDKDGHEERITHEATRSEEMMGEQDEGEEVPDRSGIVYAHVHADRSCRLSMSMPMPR